MLIIVNPIGNFPLNDDWMYSRVVAYMVNKHYYFASDWYSPVLTAQVLWGTLFCLPFGFSFTALRISVIVLGFAAVIVFYLLVNRFTSNRKLSLVCALLLLVNPLFFPLANSFMTDVPFLAFAIFAIFFFSKAFDSPKLKYILPAIAFSVIATLIRQFGVVIPLAFGLTQLMKSNRSIFSRLKYLLPAIVAVIALEFTIKWLKHIGSEMHPYQDTPISEFLSKPNLLASQIFERSSFLLYYCGLFLFPVLLFSGIKSFKGFSPGQKKGAGIFLLFFIPSLLFSWWRFPIGNMLNSGAVGPRTLHDVAFLHINDVDNISSFARTAFSVIGLIGAILLLLTMVNLIIRIINPEEENTVASSPSQRIFVVLCTLGYAFLMCVPDFFFDRYLMPIIPLVLLIVISQVALGWQFKRLLFYFSLMYVFALGYFSSAATHDYIQWNRSRWEALSYLTKEMKISPHKIDGGYEFNGWTIGTYFPPNKDKSWWFVDDDEYMISFGEIPGYNILKKYPYTNYFPHEERNIYIVHRK